MRIFVREDGSTTREAPRLIAGETNLHHGIFDRAQGFRHKPETYEHGWRRMAARLRAEHAR